MIVAIKDPQGFATITVTHPDGKQTFIESHMDSATGVETRQIRNSDGTQTTQTITTDTATGMTRTEE
jgi:hypothetical protein